MTPRSVLRYESWTLQPDREPGAEPVLHAMQCAVDGETSPASEDFTEPQNWVLRHCGQNPSHHTYRETNSAPPASAARAASTPGATSPAAPLASAATSCSPR